jgi:predicted nucleic acid-binding protein
VIFDTNILIYLSKNLIKPEAILNADPAISIITKVEALGFQFKDPVEDHIISELCNVLPVIPITDEIANATIALRKNYRIKLPDAFIYATALVEKKPLLTNNIADFAGLGDQVKLIDPFKL